MVSVPCISHLMNFSLRIDYVTGRSVTQKYTHTLADCKLKLSSKLDIAKVNLIHIRSLSDLRGLEYCQEKDQGIAPVKIRILDVASQDLIDGARFYENQEALVCPASIIHKSRSTPFGTAARI